MRLVVISGFLGAGKTTLLARIAPRLANDPARVVVIENEASSPGVDGPVLADAGLAVREVYGGCICCTLRHNLRQTLYDIAQALDPEVIVIEPSGVADPADVAGTAAETGLPFDRIQTVVLVDSERFERIRAICGPFLERSIAQADVCAISKADLLDPPRADALEAELRASRPGRPVLRIAARDGRGVEELLAALNAAPAGDPPAIGGHGLPPDSIARRAEFSFRPALPAASVVARIAELHEWLAGVLAQSPTPVAGHIKSRVEMAGGTVLVRSASFDRPPEVEGDVAGDVDHAILTCNVILVGGGLGTAAALVDSELARLSSGT